MGLWHCKRNYIFFYFNYLVLSKWLKLIQFDSQEQITIISPLHLVTFYIFILLYPNFVRSKTREDERKSIKRKKKKNGKKKRERKQKREKEDKKRKKCKKKEENKRTKKGEYKNKNRLCDLLSS